MTSFGTVDTVMAKNWIKRVSDTLTDMELDDELKLKVATRLLDKSVVVGWDNLNLHSRYTCDLELFCIEI